MMNKQEACDILNRAQDRHDILVDLKESLVNARSSRDVGWGEALAVEEAERKLGRRLTDEEYNQAHSDVQALFKEAA